MEATHILIADDDLYLVELLKDCLGNCCGSVLTAEDGYETLKMIREHSPDLVILDIMMPGLDGLQVLQRLREWSQIPIIMLSARGTMEDKVKCLELGADDYITKPFRTVELTARVRAVLRRSKLAGASPARSSYVSGDFRVDFNYKRVTLAGKELKFTLTEFNLLQELVLNAGAVLSYEYLLKKVWGSEYKAEHEYLHVYINRIREKVITGSKTVNIITVPKTGYRFESRES